MSQAMSLKRVMGKISQVPIAVNSSTIVAAGSRRLARRP